MTRSVSLMLLVVLLGLLPAGAEAQRRVQIQRADSMAGSTSSGETVHYLVGGVFVTQDKTELWAEKATWFVDQDRILLETDVMIVEEGDTLVADTVSYDTHGKVGYATSNMSLTDGDVEVTAPSGRYYVDQKWGVFEEGLNLVDSAATVVDALRGEYFSEEKRAEFAGDVRLNEDRTYMEADSVTYFRETEVSVARHNVFMRRMGGDEEEGEPVDSLRMTYLMGNRVWNDNKNRHARIDDNPLVIQLRTDSTGEETDTLVLRSRTIEIVRTDSLERVTATDSVRMWRSDLGAVADSVVFDRYAGEGDRPQEMHLFRGPVIWFEDSQITGDTLLMKGMGDHVDSVFVRENAFVAQLDTVLQRINQIKGRYLTGVLRDDSLRSLFIGPNAQALYFKADDEDKPDGATQASADNIRILLEKGKTKRVSFLEGVEGTHYSENLMPEGLALEGYTWMPERRPQKLELMDHPGLQRFLRELPPGNPQQQTATR